MATFLGVDGLRQVVDGHGNSGGPGFMARMRLLCLGLLRRSGAGGVDSGDAGVMRQAGFGARVCGGLLRLLGWRVVYREPPGPKVLAILYPHTSNWDFVLGMLALRALELPVHWAAKDTLFTGPFGSFFYALGGVPVNRRERTGFVGQMAEEFRRRDAFMLAMAPEGTRSRTEYWKSGFYRLALEAKVPVGLAFMDYPRREMGVDTWLDMSGDVASDMDRIRAAYAGRAGKRHALAGPIRLKEE